jgi:hypothetical protein
VTEWRDVDAAGGSSPSPAFISQGKVESRIRIKLHNRRQSIYNTEETGGDFAPVDSGAGVFIRPVGSDLAPDSVVLK